jgi:hypothetical protein
MIDHLSAIIQHAYYCGELDAGRRACERALSLPPVETVEETIRANRTWYTEPLAGLVDVSFQRFDIEPAYEGWSLFNPSIMAHEGRLLAVVRSSNYRIVNGQYVMPDADAGVIRTANILCDVDAAMGVSNARTIADVAYRKSGYPVDGFEDCRLRHTQTGIGVSATVRNIAGLDGRCRIATADLDVESATLSNMKVMTGVSPQDHEKNWMPWQRGWAYSCSHDGHVVTVEPDPELDGGWQLCQRSTSPPIARAFRGGSQLVPFHDGWLCLVHEVAWLGDRRAYEHRFVWFDTHMTIARVSPPFAFRETQAIEFAAGLAQLGDDLYATFGVRDAEAWMARVDADDVWRLLSPATCG